MNIDETLQTICILYENLPFINLMESIEWLPMRLRLFICKWYLVYMGVPLEVLQ